MHDERARLGVSMVISARSLAGSYGIFANSSVLMASGPPRLMPIV